MKYSNNRNRTEEPVYLMIGGVAFLIFIILFCVIVWGITHRKDKDIVINQNTLQSIVYGTKFYKADRRSIESQYELLHDKFVYKKDWI